MYLIGVMMMAVMMVMRMGRKSPSPRLAAVRVKKDR